MSGHGAHDIIQFRSGQLNVLIGPRTVLAGLESLLLVEDGPEVERLLNRVLRQRGSSAVLRAQCVRWQLDIAGLNRQKDAAFADWLAARLRTNALTIGVTRDHQLASAASAETIEVRQARIALLIRQASASQPLQRGPAANLAAMVPQPAAGSGLDVTVLLLEARLAEVLRRALDGDYLSSELKHLLGEALNPEAIATTIAVLATWAASRTFGADFAVDALLPVAGPYAMGTAVFDGMGKLITFLELTVEAEDSADLDDASKLLAGAIALLGVGLFIRLITRGASNVKALRRTAA